MMRFALIQPDAQRLTLIGAVAAFIVSVFVDSFGSMWYLWQNSDHSYGLLVLPISAFLIWRLRRPLKSVPIAVEGRWLLVLGPVVLGWVTARLAGIQLIEHFLALAMIPATVAVLCGKKIVRRLLFPLVFLLFATPFGDSLVPILMVVTADISSVLLKLTGLPFLRNGQYISLPGGEFVVADVCSGVRYLSSGVLVALLFGYLSFASVKKQALLVVATAIILVGANGLRAYIVMAVASATEMRYLAGRDHVYFGWALFAIVIVVILWFASRFEDVKAPHSADGGTDELKGSFSVPTQLPLIAALGLVMLAVTIRPLQADFGELGMILVAIGALAVFVFILWTRATTDRLQPSGASEPSQLRFAPVSVATIVATVAILAVAPRYAATVQRNTAVFVNGVALEPSLACDNDGPWQGKWSPSFGDAGFSVARAYSCSGTRVGVFVAAFVSARWNRELISSEDRIVPAGNAIGSRSTFSFPGPAGKPVTVVETEVNLGSDVMVVWRWYQVDQWATASPVGAKVYQLLALLRGGPAGGRVVVITAGADGGLQSARTTLASIANQIIGESSATTSRQPD